MLFRCTVGERALCVCHLLCVTLRASAQSSVCGGGSRLNVPLLFSPNTNSLSIIFKALSSELRRRVCSCRPRDEMCTLARNLLNIWIPFHRSPRGGRRRGGGGGNWVECEHGRNLILQAVPLCLRRPLGTCWMVLVPREEKRGRGKERRREERRSHISIVMLRASDNPHTNRNSEQKGNTACRGICAKPRLDSYCLLLVIFCGLRRGGEGRSAARQAHSQMQILWNKLC